MIRRIRDLLYEQGFTISGARNRLQELHAQEREQRRQDDAQPEAAPAGAPVVQLAPADATVPLSVDTIRRALIDLRELLT